MFSFIKKSPKVYSNIENHIFGIITELLKLNTTDINCDELGGKYYLSNEELHFSVTVFNNESVIRLTNTRDSVVEKYDRAFVEDILKAIKEEKHHRMELVCDSITNSIEKMAERLHNTLLQSNGKENKTIRLVEVDKFNKDKMAN